MNTILTNGKFYINKNNFQESIFIENGTIKEVGSNVEILKNQADNIIDLQGKTVLPGLNDSHLHLYQIGEAMSLCDLVPAKSIDDVIEIGRQFLEKNKDLKFLKGRGWNQDYFISGESRLLNRFDLDRISTEIPIVFDRVCGHVVTGNTKALEMLSINENVTVEGGEICLGEDGKPNGILTENATAILKYFNPERNEDDIERVFIKAADYALSLGLTSVQSCDIMDKDFQSMFNIIHNVYDNNKTKLRYSHQYNFQNINDFESYLETEFKTGQYDERFLSRGALKLFKDGSLGARTALMLQDYADSPGIRGVSALSDEQLQDLCDLATENGIRVITHAIGNGAVESVINAYENTMENGESPLRHGIVHCQITNTAQLNRITNLNIPVMFQPIFLDYDTKIVESRVGKELAKTSYAFNTLYNLGVPVSLGTDSPVESCNPFPNIYCAVNSLDLDGNPVGGFNPSERMSVEDAIDAYTIGSAYNEFKENFKGRLHPGYVADLIVLDEDIFTIDPVKIKDIKVDITMIDGEIVYKR